MLPASFDDLIFKDLDGLSLPLSPSFSLKVGESEFNQKHRLTRTATTEFDPQSTHFCNVILSAAAFAGLSTHSAPNAVTLETNAFFFRIHLELVSVAYRLGPP